MLQTSKDPQPSLGSAGRSAPGHACGAMATPSGNVDAGVRWSRARSRAGVKRGSKVPRRRVLSLTKSERCGVRGTGSAPRGGERARSSQVDTDTKENGGPHPATATTATEHLYRGGGEVGSEASVTSHSLDRLGENSAIQPRAQRRALSERRTAWAPRQRGGERPRELGSRWDVSRGG